MISAGILFGLLLLIIIKQKINRMNKRLPGILFGSMLFVYALLMTLSYTSCSSDNSNDKVSSAPATDSSNMTSTDTTNKMALAKKTKKGKAMIAPSVANSEKAKMMKGKDGVYMNPQTMPEYPGGETALSQYMESSLDYPQHALDDSKEGTVKVSFVIDENGNVMAPAVIGNKLGDGLDEEAISLIKKMPKWKPGTVKGKNVKTRLDLPITFQISGES
jgi:TonB family protein